MDLGLIATTITVVVSIFIALAAYKAQTDSSTNKSFALFTILASVWVAANYLSNHTEDYSMALFWNQIIFASTSLLFGALFFFIHTYPHKKSKLNSFYVALLTALSVGLAASSFTPLMVQDIQIQEGFSEIIFGPFENIYFFFAIVIFIASLIIMIQKYRKARGIERQQLQYLFYGLSVAVTGNLFFNLLLPLVSGDFSFSNIGPLFLLVFLGVVLLGIRQHRLFDIRFLVGKSIYYTIISSIPYFGFFIIAYLFERIFNNIFSFQAFVIAVPISVAYTYLASKFNKYLQNYTDTKLINPDFNPLEVINKFNHEVNEAFDFTTLSNKTFELISKTIRPAKSALIILNTDEDQPELSFTSDDSQLNSSEFLFSLQIWKKTSHKILIKDELSNTNDNISININLEKRLKDLLEQTQYEALIPLIQENKVVGILLLGSKEEDSPYTTQDVEFIMQLSSSLSLAVGRSLLHLEVETFNQQLQQKVEEATSELKVKNNKLEDALDKLEDARRQERDMVDVMGHELRTPLSIVRNALLVLDQEYKNSEGNISDEKLRKYLDMAIESVRREHKLLETLLSATKLEGNKLELDFEKIDMKDVIHDSIEAHKYKAEEKKLELKVNQPEEEVFCYGDRVRTQEIMDNFVSNAVKYTAKGSVVISMTKLENMAKIEVKDSGVGISSEDLKKLGRKFFRAKKLYGEDENYVHPSGTGLGLYVTFELIELMGGERWVESEIGKGSTFAFALPLFTGQEDKHNVKKLFKMDGIKPV